MTVLFCSACPGGELWLVCSFPEVWCPLFAFGYWVKSLECGLPLLMTRTAPGPRPCVFPRQTLGLSPGSAVRPLSLIFEKLILHVVIFPVCMSMHPTDAWCPRRPEPEVRPPGTGVGDGYEPPNGVLWESIPCSSLLSHLSRPLPLFSFTSALSESPFYSLPSSGRLLTG